MDIKLSYQERLEYMARKLTALMVSIERVFMNGSTDESSELIEQRLGEFCYTMELALYSGDLSVANVAIATGEESKVAINQLKHQPMSLLNQLEKAMQFKKPEVTNDN
jgi:hypothetical protein